MYQVSTDLAELPVSNPDQLSARPGRIPIKRLSSSFTLGELRALLTQAKAVCERDWLMLLTVYWHSLRVSEVVSIKAKDFADERLAIERRPQGRYARPVQTREALIAHSDPLLDEAACFAEYVRTFGPEDRIFPINRTQAD